ncbi:MAG: filamentous hemagglutinin N-terminal domain-containing protein, partial [Candidatus Omnitrophica bacterium]|nr:filamentous hemagglutinin N-terminal domain-containing protein [Candidatus Omnitrophota bacterium]
MSFRNKIYLIASAFLLAVTLNAYANPEGESVAAGTATFDRSTPNTLTVNTTSNNTIINYNSFNIAANETTRFNQPNAGSAVLNRVTGVNPSEIYGTMSSNGKLFLVNPNGIIFGAGSSVNAPAIVASTLDIANEDFLRGNYNFFKNGESAFIINHGRLAASPGGFITLLSQSVNNQGIIIADLGTVVLASGEKMTLALDSLEQISVVIDDAVKAEVLGPDGQKMDSAIKNSGTIQANGGKVILTAKVLNNVFDYAVNNSGVILANNVVEHNGVVELVASGAPVINTGTIQAGQVNVNVTGAGFINKGQIITDGIQGLPNGGVISIQAATILQQGEISANAYENGTAGEVSIVSATSTVLDESSSTEAMALGIIGNGGRILIDSTGGNTTVNKNAVIDVSAGAIAGNAGFIEVSAYKQLGFFGILSGRAPPGYNGATILLDPEDVILAAVSYPAGSISTVWATNNITINGTQTLGIGSILNLFADHNSDIAGEWHDGIGQVINGGAYGIIGTSATLNLKAGDGIGSSLNPIITNVANLSFEINPTLGSNGVYITQTAGNLNLTSASTRNGAISLQLAARTLNITGAVNSGTATIDITAGAINISSPVTGGPVTIT